MRCLECGAEMVPMIMSSFCPNDCDRGLSPSIDAIGDAEVVADFLPHEAHRQNGDIYTRWTKHHAAGYWTLVLFDGVDKEDHWITPHVRQIVNNARHWAITRTKETRS